MIARGTLLTALVALLALAAPPASAEAAPWRSCDALTSGGLTAKVAVKGWSCTEGAEVLAAWLSVVRQRGDTPASAPRRTRVASIGCRKRTTRARVSLRCRDGGDRLRARWRR